MAYIVPTATEFKDRFPAFVAVEDHMCELALDEASHQVDEKLWTEFNFRLGIMLYAAHLLTLDGFGSSNDAKMVGFQLIRSGSLTLQRDTNANAGTSDLRSTGFGRRFSNLVRENFPGVLVV
jgi:hypothetical protein